MLTSAMIKANNATWNIFGQMADAVVAVKSDEIKQCLAKSIGTGIIRTKHNMLSGRLVAFATLADDTLSVFVTEDATGSDLAELKWRMESIISPDAGIDFAV